MTKVLTKGTVADSLKYFLCSWKAITSDSTIVDMIEHCPLEFVTVPYQQYFMPAAKSNKKIQKFTVMGP